MGGSSKVVTGFWGFFHLEFLIANVVEHECHSVFLEFKWMCPQKELVNIWDKKYEPDSFV
jgi:hypothetical protein